MQLDLQSVEKYLSVRSQIGLPRLRMSRSFLQDVSRAASRFSEVQLQEITVRTFSIQLGQIRLQLPIGSEKTFFSIRWTIVIIFDPVGSKKC